LKKKSNLKKLFEPMYIGNIKFKNRLFKPASGSRMMFENDGFVNRKGMAWYEALAKGGVGCVIVESPAIDEPLSLKKPGDFRIDDDKYIPGLKELVDVIHKYDCPAILQLYHAGPWHQREDSGFTPVSASPHGEPEFKGNETVAPCEELSIEKIKIIEQQFIDAAERAAKAGFDGVEVNAGGNHLLSTFLSKYWNYRHDEYGCDSYENRARICVNIIKGIKERLGDDYPVPFLMNGLELSMGELGQTIEESQELAKLIEAAGADAFHVRVFELDNCACYWPEFYYYPEAKDPLPAGMDFSHKGAGSFTPTSYAIKQVVSKPVIAPGRWDYSLEFAEKMLQEGKIDAIGLVRGLQADTELPNKIMAGKEDDIVPCTSCMTCIEGHQFPIPPPIRCRINTFLGEEDDYNSYVPAEKKKKVLVAGGGSAGLEAARVAAVRGHDVTLYSNDSFLGGLMNMATVIKGNYPEDMEKVINFYKYQLKKLKVTIKTGKEVTLKVVEKLKPDVVIVATGGVTSDTVLPGSDNKKVVSSTTLRKQLNLALKISSPGKLSKATKLWMPIGKSVVVMGGDIKGSQLAEFLVKRGKKVTIVWEGDLMAFGEGMNLMNVYLLGLWLAEKGCVMIPEAKFEEITDEGLIITTSDGKKMTLKADSIVPVMPLKKNEDLYDSLQGKVPEVYKVGACNDPAALIKDAVAEGAKVANSI
jgi:2,4-dienoyl-CoA reductase (NADPH2)